MRGDIRCYGGGTESFCGHFEFHHLSVRTWMDGVQSLGWLLMVVLVLEFLGNQGVL